MPSKDIIPDLTELQKLLVNGNEEYLQTMLTRMLNLMMELEVSSKINAQKYERTKGRSTYCNGTRKRTLASGVGELNLQIPKMRSGESYYPSFLEPRRMVDKALVNVIQEAYINGVSTRKIDRLVEDMGMKIDKSSVSRLCKELEEAVEAFRNRPLTDEYPYIWLHATFPKIREGGRVQKTLIRRGLKGVKLVISDAHEGLKNAIACVLPGTSWQRCRVHCMRYILCHVARKQQGMVSAMVHTIFAQDNIDDARKQLRTVVAQLSGHYPKAMSVLENAEEEIHAYMEFPQAHHPQIHSTNPLERLNKEIRRRSNVVSIFPNRASVIRLIGSVLMEQQDEWLAGDKRYMSLESMSKLKCKFGKNLPQPLQSLLEDNSQ